MGEWKTYLIMYFGTCGINPTQVADTLESLGFETIVGSVDFIHRWKDQPTKTQILELADKVSVVLKGSGAVFNLDTHD